MGPLAPPRDLTIPGPGSTTARDVLSRAIGRLLGELPRVGAGAVLTAHGRADLAAFHRLTRLALARSPGAVASALRRPTAGALLRALRPERRGALAEEPLLAELEAIVYQELAAAGALPEPVRMRRVPRRILSLAGRIAIDLPEDARGLAFENGRMIVDGPGGPARVDLDTCTSDTDTDGPRITRPYASIEEDLVLALCDNNPLAMNEAHPEKSGNAVDLGGKTAAMWADALREALAPVARHLPALRQELGLYIHQIVPVGYDAKRHLSASYQEAIGTIYLSLHPSQMTLAEALIHELSHNKLNALFELDEVLENAFSPLYASPVRPDPRPLHGVLLAIHAFLPVALLYERMIEADDPLARHDSFRERFHRIRAQNREGADVVLRHARPTRVGQGLLDEIAGWRDHFDEVWGA